MFQQERLVYMRNIIRLIKNTIFAILSILFIVCGFYACASQATPTGGDYDVTPPAFVRSTPEPNTIQFTGNKIELYFDEYISIDKPNEKLIITPPQHKNPVIKSLGKRISVELKDSLVANTTYTFDFTDAIIDNNEQNALEGFTFAFSTGEVLDSLVVSGILLNAENLEPMPNIMVGLHSNPDDTAFTKTPFLRTSKTNDRGRFWIRNIAPGEYRIFALQDMNRDYMFNQPQEAIAFYDKLIVPSFEPAVRQDTLWLDSLTIDTIRQVNYTRFTPDDIVLMLFNETFEPQYLAKSERLNQRQFAISFASEHGFPPEVNLLDTVIHDWYVREYGPDPYMFTYWITDSLIYQRDTLKLELDYLADDSLYKLVAHRDTLKLNLKKKPADEKKKNSSRKDSLNIAINISNLAEVYDTLKFTFSEPVTIFTEEMVTFQQKVDTLWEDRKLRLRQDSLNPRLYYSDFRFTYGGEYRVELDSMMVKSVYEHWNTPVSSTFKARIEEEYGHIYVMIHGNDGRPGLGQLLDAGDNVVKESLLVDGELSFENLKPGKYYLRYIDDLNNNGKWDTGYYAEKEQPEPVYYFESFFEVRQYSEIEQNWNIKVIPVERQKPIEITKNKPVEKKPKRNEDTKQQQNSNTNQSAGTPRLF